MKNISKKKIIILLTLNILITLLLLSPYLLISQPDLCFDQVSFSTSSGSFEHTWNDLQPGIYDVQINYATNIDGVLLKNSASGNAYPVLYAEDQVLPSASNELTYRLWANSKLNSFTMSIAYSSDNLSPESALNINTITITRNLKSTLSYHLLKILFILFLLDVLYFCYLYRNCIMQKFYVILGLFIIWLLSSLGLFSAFQLRGHDLLFHLARIIGLADSIKSGNFPVQMYESWYNQYSYPVSVFYGDLLLYFPSLLYVLGVPLSHAYKIYVALINLGTIFISYKCFKKISHNSYIGLACSAFYTLSLNRIINIYLRAALGEYSAAMFLPLIVLSIYNIFTEDSSCKEYKRNWLPLCIGMTGIIYTHTLSLEMVGIFLIIICLFNFKKIFHKETFLTLCTATAGTLFLSAAFLIPFLDYSREDLLVFRERSSYGIQSFGLSFYELFSFCTVGYGLNASSEGGLQNRIPVSVGIVSVLIILLAICLLAKCSTWAFKERSLLFSSLFFSLFALFFATIYFPWDLLSKIPFVQKVVASLEFPWRFVTISMVLLTLTTCLCLMKLLKILSSKNFKLAVISLCFLISLQGLYQLDLISRQTSVYTLYDGSFLVNRLSAISPEYLYTTTDVDSVMKDASVFGQNATITNYDRISGGAVVRVSCHASSDSYIELPIFAYPYYKCIDVATNTLLPVTAGDNHKIRIMLPDHFSGNLHIYFQEPIHWRIGELISLGSLIYILWYCYNARHHNR